MSGELLVALTFDLDPDHFDHSLATDYRETVLQWRGIEEAVPRLADYLEGVTGSDGRSARATWFLRADNQIGAIYGDPGAMIERHAGLLAELTARGDEVAWHPHLYRDTAAGWSQERDEARLRALMKEAHAAITRHGLRPISARIGENYGSSGIMATLDELGIRYDSTAMPGRRRDDGERCFDWSPSPDTPYRPSKIDYRVPGTPAHKVIEVPMTMVPVKATYDVDPLLRYVDLSFHPNALRDGLSERLPGCNFLVTVTHPSCLLPGIVQQTHGLLAFDFGAFEENLAYLIECCRRSGRRYRFTTLSNGAATQTRAQAA